jgi:hypothetical protein
MASEFISTPDIDTAHADVLLPVTSRERTVFVFASSVCVANEWSMELSRSTSEGILSVAAASTGFTMNC